MMIEWLTRLSTSQATLGGLLLFNTISLIVLFASSLVKNVSDLMLHRRKFWLEREITFLENQLSGLYGPMYAMLKTNERLAAVAKAGSAADYQQAIWRDVIIPNNTKAVNLLQANFHLLGSQEIPEHMLAFIAHAEWQRMTGGATGSVPSGVLPFPREFSAEVYQRTEALKEALNNRRQKA